MIAVGVGLIAVGVIFGDVWGPVRLLSLAAGVVLAVLGFLLALGERGVRIRASTDGGIEASADMPAGYTKTLTVSESLTEGASPPKEGMMPPKEGIMPPKGGTMPVKGGTDASTPGLPGGPAAGGTAPDHPRSSAEP